MLPGRVSNPGPLTYESGTLINRHFISHGLDHVTAQAMLSPRFLHFPLYCGGSNIMFNEIHFYCEYMYIFILPSTK